MSKQAEQKKIEPRYRDCPTCGRPAALVDDRVRWSGWHCSTCGASFKTCNWPREARGLKRCGALLPEGELPLSCPRCMSILSMAAAPKRKPGLVVQNVLGLAEMAEFKV
jgi:ribosomal protein L37AE/L43A